MANAYQIRKFNGKPIPSMACSDVRGPRACWVPVLRLIVASPRSSNSSRRCWCSPRSYQWNDIKKGYEINYDRTEEELKETLKQTRLPLLLLWQVTPPDIPGPVCLRWLYMIAIMNSSLFTPPHINSTRGLSHPIHPDTLCITPDITSALTRGVKVTLYLR